MKNQKDRPEAKNCFKDIKKVWDELVKKYDEPLVKWGFSKKLNWERERVSLLKRKQVLEKELANVEEELK